VKRTTWIAFAVSVSLALVTYWVARNTEWVDATIPAIPRGEALINPFYAAQKFVDALGAHSTWDRAFTAPQPTAIIVVSAWHWNLFPARRDSLKQWVESGGRLVADRSMEDSDRDFERWSGIRHEFRSRRDRRPPEQDTERQCSTFEESDAEAPGAVRPATYQMCDVFDWSSLKTHKAPTWSLSDASGIQAIRVRVGRGSVTMINATPFRYQSFLDGDHARLLAAAIELHRGDEVHFLSEDDHPSLLAMIWHHGAPVVALTLVLAALLLWRDCVRFGPLAAPHEPARRSLAEQIRGTAQFALRYGSDAALHAACVRALDEAAARRLKIYSRLTGGERTAALARLTGFDEQTLAAAITNPDARTSHELRRTIALLEAARRHVAVELTRPSYGTR
jgi:hypothetical protein